jgi:predicted HAD superfamily phosphohydrolase YqeG
MPDDRNDEEKGVTRCKSNVPVDGVDTTPSIDVQPTAQASGDRVVVLMDLDNGLVGWESDDDPDNPQ